MMHSRRKFVHRLAFKSSVLCADTGPSTSRCFGPRRLTNANRHVIHGRPQWMSSSASISDKGDLAHSQSSNDPPTNVKSGSPSPWAVYEDVWSSPASTSSMTEEQVSLLGPESVKIDDSTETDSETKILEAYNAHLKSRSSSHFGYPYNLAVRGT